MSMSVFGTFCLPDRRSARSIGSDSGIIISLSVSFVLLAASSFSTLICGVGMLATSVGTGVLFVKSSEVLVVFIIGMPIEPRLARIKNPAIERQHKRTNTNTTIPMIINTLVVDCFIIFLVSNKLSLNYKVYSYDRKRIASECRKYTKKVEWVYASKVSFACFF